MGGGRQRQGQGSDMMKEFSQLTIAQTASMAKVAGKSGRLLAFYSSNSSDKSGTEEDSPVAQWQQDRLVVVTQTRIGSTTRSYELSPDRKQLYVTTRIENQRLSQPVVFRFVYDSIKPSE